MIVPFAFVLAELVQPTLLMWRRGWLLIVLLVCGAGVLFSYSRAAWLNLALVVTTMIAAYAFRRGGLRHAAKTVGLGLAAVGTLVAALFLTGSTTFFLTRAHIQYYDASRFQGQDESFRLARNGTRRNRSGGIFLCRRGSLLTRRIWGARGARSSLGWHSSRFSFFAVTLVLACGNVVRGQSTFRESRRCRCSACGWG